MSSSTSLTNTAAAKATAPEISKPEPFAGFRFKFKAFYTQVRLDIWADNKRPVEKRLIRYINNYAL
jgi:hypothetical protein